MNAAAMKAEELLLRELDRLSEAPGAVEKLRAFVLELAMTGRLSAAGSTEVPASWPVRALKEVSESVTDGDHLPPPKADTGVPFLVISNVRTGVIDFSNCRFVPNDYYDRLHISRRPRRGDILYTVVGSYGIPVLVDTDKPFCVQRHIAIIGPTNLVTQRFSGSPSPVLSPECKRNKPRRA